MQGDPAKYRKLWGQVMGLPLKHSSEPDWFDIWSSVCDRLRMELGQRVFDTWIAPLSFTSVNDGHVRLSAPRRLVRDYVVQHHATRMERAFAAMLPGFVAFEICITQTEARTTPPPAKTAPVSTS